MRTGCRSKGACVVAVEAAASKTLVKGIGLLQLLAAEDTALSLADLADRTGWPKPTLHRVITTLVEHGMIGADDGRYRVGVQCLVLGGAFIRGLDLRHEAHPYLEDLVRLTGETAHLAVQDGPLIVYVDKVESPKPVRMHSWLGATNQLYCTGVGKAILAFSDEQSRAEVLTGPLTARTPQTITEPLRLEHEVAKIRSRGFSLDNEENEPSIRCVGAPVFDHRRVVVAGLSVSAPTFRFTLQQAMEAGAVVKDAARALSEKLGAEAGAALGN